MKIGLVSYRCRNRDISFNMSQIERALMSMKGKADLLCFSEAFLQGFDSLCWNYETDKDIAVSRDSEIMQRLSSWTREYDIERDDDRLYSSYAVMADGEMLCNYRRISKGWKEYERTDGHYREGNDICRFLFMVNEFTIALCGDLWEYPERFVNDGILLWPIYVNFTKEDWLANELEAYAKQASLASSRALMVNPLDDDPHSCGGSCFFLDGRIAERTEFGKEEILAVEI